MNAVVIGGGLGGLSTALRLQSRGWHVTVCEAGPTLGGKMNWLRIGDYGFDTGPSLITMPQVFSELFGDCGEDMRDHIELIRMDPHAEYRFTDGGRVTCPADTEAWRETIRSIEPRDVTGFDRLHALGRKLYELSNRTFFQRSPFSRPSASEFFALRFFPVLHAWGRYSSAVEHFLRSPWLRRIYNRYPTYVGSSPYLSPATLLIIPFLEREFGAWYVRGGLYRIVDALATLLVRRGASLRCNARVDRIENRGGRVSGVRLADGAHLPAQAVIMNGDAGLTNALLGNPAQDSTLQADSRSLSGFVMLSPVKSRLKGLGHHTVLFSENYQAEFSDLFERRVFPSDPTVYISAPATTDPSIAPSDGDALFIMANAPVSDRNWETPDTEFAASRVRTTLQRAGMNFEPDERTQIFDPARIAGTWLAPGGAIYGTNSHGWKRAFYRPPNRSPEIGGLYFVGGSTHPGGGTPTVVMSARIVTRMIEADARA